MDLYAPVAQSDRAPDFGSGGWGFDSLRARFFAEQKTATLIGQTVQWTVCSQTEESNAGSDRVPACGWSLRRGSTAERGSARTGDRFPPGANFLSVAKKNERYMIKANSPVDLPPEGKSLWRILNPCILKK